MDILSRLGRGEFEADSRVRTGQQELVGAELDQRRAADRLILLGIGRDLHPGPTRLAESPKAIACGDLPAPAHRRLVGCVISPGDADRRMFAGAPRPTARARAPPP